MSLLAAAHRIPTSNQAAPRSEALAHGLSSSFSAAKLVSFEPPIPPNGVLHAAMLCCNRQPARRGWAGIHWSCAWVRHRHDVRRRTRPKLEQVALIDQICGDIVSLLHCRRCPRACPLLHVGFLIPVHCSLLNVVCDLLIQSTGQHAAVHISINSAPPAAKHAHPPAFMTMLCFS